MPSEIQIDRFRRGDVADFLRMAQAEGWVCDPWEFAFILQANPAGCFAARSGGRCLGFVTSIAYERSGWIGNLLVTPEGRGQGIGRRLFTSAMGTLDDAGVGTIWITASADGAPLYASLGFGAIDTIQRWRGIAVSSGSLPQHIADSSVVAPIDAAGWGDSRRKLLQPLLQRGTLVADDGGFLLLQDSAVGTQIGPWGAVSAEAAAGLLDKASTPAAAAKSVFLDSPAGNGDVVNLLADNGFAVTGSTQLMYCGKTPAYDPVKIFAMASMGSMG